MRGCMHQVPSITATSIASALLSLYNIKRNFFHQNKRARQALEHLTSPERTPNGALEHVYD